MDLLRFEQICRSFPSNGPDAPARSVLRDIHLSLGVDEVVALIGRSGAGKTTLLYLAAGLCRPTAGRVLFEERDLASLDQGELSRLRRRQIGLVFQNNLSLSALPVWENAALPLLLEGVPSAKARRHAEQMLERVGLASFSGAPMAALSGGQRRRLGVARAMVGRPRLILADEPTADLDDETGAEIEALLFGWLTEEKRAALIVTHSPRIERAAARTLRLEEGRLIEVSKGPCV
jgi:ABC-type lipoprotein export system ATPase subunit